MSGRPRRQQRLAVINAACINGRLGVFHGKEGLLLLD